jgi:hypothetical protein
MRADVKSLFAPPLLAVIHTVCLLYCSMCVILSRKPVGIVGVSFYFIFSLSLATAGPPQQAAALSLFGER